MDLHDEYIAIVQKAVDIGATDTPLLHKAVLAGDIRFDGVRYEEDVDVAVGIGEDVWWPIGFEGEEKSIEKTLARRAAYERTSFDR